MKSPQELERERHRDKLLAALSYTSTLLTITFLAVGNPALSEIATDDGVNVVEVGVMVLWALNFLLGPIALLVVSVLLRRRTQQ